MRPLGTAEEVAKLFNVKRETVYRWVYYERFQPGCYIASVRRFNLDKIERLILAGDPLKKGTRYCDTQSFDRKEHASYQKIVHEIMNKEKY